jgi:hypothetical protein
MTEAGKILLVASLCLSLLSCRQVPKRVQAEPTKDPQSQGKYGLPKILGSIKNSSINESSGLVASRSVPGAYWTHNDSGDGPFIYAIGSRGESLGVWRVAGAQAVDWEDISVGPGPDQSKTYLYIGDIGDNDSARENVVVYRVIEPTPTADKSTRTKPQATEPAEPIRLRYPDGRHDAEALLVDPATGNLYIVTKVALDSPSVYEAVAPFVAGKTITMKNLGRLKLPSLFGGVITGGSVSPDGKQVALCDYFEGYELVLPPNSASFNDIWKQPIASFNFGKRKQGEAIAYRLDGRALVGTSEGRRSSLIEVSRN